MMKPISQIRIALESVTNAFYDSDPERSSRGPDEGLMRTIWNERGEFQDDSLAPLDPPATSEFSYADLYDLFEYGADVDTDLIKDVMGGPVGDHILRSVQVRGVDALAYYVTFHVRGPQWGIYLPLSSVAFMIAKVFSSIEADAKDHVKLAIRALHQHELFHFATDYASSQVEVLTQRPCHKPARSLRQPLGYIALEEQLANSNMIRSFWGRRLSGKTNAIRRFVDMQPPGYKDANGRTNTTAFTEDCDRLIGMYVNSAGEHSERVLHGLDGSNLLPNIPVDWRYCPVHLVADEYRCGLDASCVDLFQNVDGLLESRTFIKSLQKLPKQIQSKWHKVRIRLAQSTAGAGLDFKLWERVGSKYVYSIRVSGSYRAHLDFDRDTGHWTASDIGSHGAMGHG